MEAVVLFGITLLTAGLLSFLIFRPVARRFQQGRVSAGVTGLFSLHALGGAALMLGAFLLSQKLGYSPIPAVLAAALGWTLPALLLAWFTARRLRTGATTGKGR